MMKILLVLVAALALAAAAPAASPYPSVLAPLVYGVSPPEAYAAAAYGPSVVYRPSVGSSWGYGSPYGGYGYTFNYGRPYY
ncbi:hypothetical protein R5R35_001965 [Gryllus longicercus]|uniref:Neuropeptide-like 4 n=1 Tax=Gryllus longicercus TaxID=2509291 RepID=A0AAN9VVZ0_9ORTH